MSSSAWGCWSRIRHDPRWPALVEELKQVTWLPPGGHVNDPSQYGAPPEDPGDASGQRT
jgi:hypothetical protein